jgi:hypothetical protein
VSRLEYCLWGLDFMIGAVGYLAGGPYAALVAFLVGAVLIFIGLSRKNESEVSPRPSILTDEGAPYPRMSRVKSWHKYGLVVSIFSIVALICFGFIRYKTWSRVVATPRDAQQNERCKIQAQQSIPQVQPSPDKASDQQLLRGSLAVQISLLDLETVDLNAIREAKHDKKEDKPEDRLCAILQEYETNIRIPAQVVQQTLFNRLPPEEKVLSETPDIQTSYQHPQSMNELKVVTNDLSRLDKSLEGAKGIKEADDSKNDWIITPLPRFTPSEPRNETDFNLVQEYSANGYVARLMDMEFSFGSPAHRSAFGSILVALKREIDWKRAQRVRIIFDAPIDEWAIGHDEGQYQLGNNFIEFTTDAWEETESVQLEISGHIRTKRMVVITGGRVK